MAHINQKIKDTIAALSTPTTYLRSIHLQEANYQLPKIALGTKPVGINANLPEITFNPSPGSTNVTYEYPIDVFFLEKQPKLDDTGEEIDLILDRMFLLANEFFDRMQPLEGSGLPLIDDYTLEAIMTLTDEVLAGYRIQFNLPDRRTVYNCG